MRPDFDASKPEHINERFAELGEAQVRVLHATGGLPVAWNLHTINWLSDQSTEKKPDASKQTR